MGFPKALLPYRDTTFLGHLVNVLRAKVDPLIVVSGAVDLSAPGATVVRNERWRDGQLTSLQCGLRALPASVEGAVVALVDHPCIDSTLVARLIAEFETHRPPLVIPTHQGRRGHPMIFARALFAELLDAPLDQGAKPVVRRHPALHVEVEDEGVLQDLDDPETYERVLGRPISLPRRPVS